MFNVALFVFGFVVLCLQPIAPLNPLGRGMLEPSTIFNTVISFMTNTNLQHYSGDQHFSNFSQIFFILPNMFLSASVGFCALAAVIRAFRGEETVGNFFVDMWRVAIYIYLPVALIFGVIFMQQGMPMTFNSAEVATTLEPGSMGLDDKGAAKPQTIIVGPVAAVIPIKMLGTNGGGFYGMNAAHPLENPTATTQLLHHAGDDAVPVRAGADVRAHAQAHSPLGRHLRRHAGHDDRASSPGSSASTRWSRTPASPRTRARPIRSPTPPRRTASSTWPARQVAGLPVDQHLGNLEGKELRFGTSAGAAFAAITTDVTCGAINAEMDSLNPLAGLSPMVGMWLNCVFGGKGVGMINLLLFLIVGVFLAGQMVGRTPEYLGRKVGAREMKLAMIALLVHPILILGPTGSVRRDVVGNDRRGQPWRARVLGDRLPVFLGLGEQRFGLRRPRRHLRAQRQSPIPSPEAVPWDIGTGLVMLFSRYLPIIAPIAMAFYLGRKKVAPVTLGTMSDDTWTFGFLLLGTITHHRRAAVLAGRRARAAGRAFRADPVRRLRRFSAIAALGARSIGNPAGVRTMDALSAPRPALNLARRRDLFSTQIVTTALKQSFLMLRPDVQWKNPVMFVVEIGAVLTLLYVIQAAFGTSSSTVSITYFIALDVWLFLTVLFANFATAIAEERGKAQAETLRKTRVATPAFRRRADGTIEKVSSNDLRNGDVVVVEAQQIIPGDGEVIEGVAIVNEAAITGESAPVIRESGGDRSGVTGGTTVLSDSIVVRISAGPGESFLDKMIALVEGARRQRTPNEIALTLVLTAFTLIFMIVVVPLWPMASNAEQYMTSYLGLGDPLQSLGTDVPTLVALVVCLIPTTIGALLAAIGIAGMDRALRANIIAKSGKAVEVAGDIDTVLLDKTGTITLGDRQAREFIPIGGVSEEELVAWRRSPRSPIRRRRARASSLAYTRMGLSRTPVAAPDGATFVPFTAQTRMSGVDLPDGAQDPQRRARRDRRHVESLNGAVPRELAAIVGKVGARGATPAGRRREQPRRGRRRARGHSQARHQGTHGAAAADGPAHGDDHRRQPAHRASHRHMRRASTISSPRRRRKRSSPICAKSRPRASSWR